MFLEKVNGPTFVVPTISAWSTVLFNFSLSKKKLKSLIPEGTDLRTDAEKEADYFTNLKENYFPNRDPFNRFMMMDPDPKVEKDLLNLKNLDVR